MLEQYTIKDINQLKALSHPARVKILTNLQSREMTAKQLADQFDEEPAKTSYHVKQLLKVGLVRLVRERTTQNGIVEKYYEAVAKEIKTDASLMGGIEALTRPDTDLAARLNHAQSEFLRHRHSGATGMRETAYGFANVDPNRMDAFVQDLQALAHRYEARTGSGSSFLFMLYPQESTEAATGAEDVPSLRTNAPPVS